jgi:hypothetical protein
MKIAEKSDIFLWCCFFYGRYSIKERTRKGVTLGERCLQPRQQSQEQKHIHSSLIWFIFQLQRRKIYTAICTKRDSLNVCGFILLSSLKPFFEVVALDAQERIPVHPSPMLQLHSRICMMLASPLGFYP